LAAIGQQYFEPFWPVGTAVAICLSPFVATPPVDMANTGMDTPTDCPRTENTAALMTEKETCT